MNIRTFIRTYALILLGIIVIVMIIWLWGYKTNLPAPETRAASDFSAAILASHPELFTGSNQPIFTIKDTQKPTENWYVLKITPKDSDGPESFIIIDDPHFGSEYMNVVAGPESKFSRQELLETKVLIPSAVIDTLRDEKAL